MLSEQQNVQQMKQSDTFGQSMMTTKSSNTYVAEPYSRKSYGTPPIINGLVYEKGYTGAAKGFVSYFAYYTDVNYQNCYTYAVGIDKNLKSPGQIALGVGWDFYTGPLSVDAIADIVVAELKELGREGRIIVGPDAPIAKNERRIAVRVGTKSFNGNNAYDYHFVLQLSDGSWAEKHGDNDPSKCTFGEMSDDVPWDMNDGDGYYDSKIIYLAITD